MRKIALAVLLLFLFSGCSAIQSVLSEYGSSSPGTASQPVSSQAEKDGASPVTPTLSPPPASTPPSSAPQTGHTPSKQPESSSRQQAFDAAQAVEITPADGGIRVVFEQLPQTAAELEALLEVYPQSDARSTGAFFLAGLLRYVDCADDGLAMIDLLRGPRPMNDTDKKFLKDRLREKAYLPGAYFEGAAPENDYTPDTPLTLTVYDDPMQAEEGYCYIQLTTTGADSPRRLTLREKDGLYYLWEYSNILTGIRLPASQDPWL